MQYSSGRFVVLLVKESTPAKMVVPGYEITESIELCLYKLKTLALACYFKFI